MLFDNAQPGQILYFTNLGSKAVLLKVLEKSEAKNKEHDRIAFQLIADRGYALVPGSKGKEYSIDRSTWDGEHSVFSGAHLWKDLGKIERINLFSLIFEP